MSTRDMPSQLFVYVARVALYLADTILTTTVIAVGLTIASAFSILVFWYLKVIELSALLLVPILGMAVYLAQWRIGNRSSEPNTQSEGELNQDNRLLVEAFVFLYYNFVFVFAAVLGILTAINFADSSFEVFAVIAFAYPMVDIEMADRFNVSLASLPVALFLLALHRLGKVTWLQIQNININRLPIVDEWFAISEERARVSK